jgi:enterochelin esterase-like enzyme
MARVAAKAAVGFVFLFVAASFVPSDRAYYEAEYILSYFGPLGSASQHLRSVPDTLSSIMSEGFQSRLLNVEGLEVNLDYAVNSTERIHEGRFMSRILGEERTYAIYLPPGYESSDERYPTLYLLHGMSQDQRWWTEVARVDRIITAMIASGKVRPAIIVMPNGNRVEREVSTTSLYDDRCETGLDIVASVLSALGNRFQGLRIYRVSCWSDFRSFVVNEVIGEIDSRYRTSGERYVGGFSVGGRGALQLALGNGGAFAGTFGLSGNYDFLRRQLRRGEIQPPEGMKLFLAAGNKDQRGIYGELNTFLFHKELARRGIEHLYCIYDGSHSDVTWVSAMPQALEYMLGAGHSQVNGVEDDGRCRGH